MGSHDGDWRRAVVGRAHAVPRAPKATAAIRPQGWPGARDASRGTASRHPSARVAALRRPALAGDPDVPPSLKARPHDRRQGRPRAWLSDSAPKGGVPERMGSLRRGRDPSA